MGVRGEGWNELESCATVCPDVRGKVARRLAKNLQLAGPFFVKLDAAMTTHGNNRYDGAGGPRAPRAEGRGVRPTDAYCQLPAPRRGFHLCDRGPQRFDRGSGADRVHQDGPGARPVARRGAVRGVAVSFGA